MLDYFVLQAQDVHDVTLQLLEIYLQSAIAPTKFYQNTETGTEFEKLEKNEQREPPRKPKKAKHHQHKFHEKLPNRRKQQRLQAEASSQDEQDPPPQKPGQQSEYHIPQLLLEWFTANPPSSSQDPSFSPLPPLPAFINERSADFEARQTIVSEALFSLELDELYFEALTNVFLMTFPEHLSSLEAAIHRALRRASSTLFFFSDDRNEELEELLLEIARTYEPPQINEADVMRDSIETVPGLTKPHKKVKIEPSKMLKLLETSLYHHQIECAKLFQKSTNEFPKVSYHLGHPLPLSVVVSESPKKQTKMDLTDYEKDKAYHRTIAQLSYFFNFYVHFSKTSQENGPPDASKPIDHAQNIHKESSSTYSALSAPDMDLLYAWNLYREINGEVHPQEQEYHDFIAKENEKKKNSPIVPAHATSTSKSASQHQKLGQKLGQKGSAKTGPFQQLKTYSQVSHTKQQQQQQQKQQQQQPKQQQQKTKQSQQQSHQNQGKNGLTNNLSTTELSKLVRELSSAFPEVHPLAIQFLLSQNWGAETPLYQARLACFTARNDPNFPSLFGSPSNIQRDVEASPSYSSVTISPRPTTVSTASALSIPSSKVTTPKASASIARAFVDISNILITNVELSQALLTFPDSAMEAILAPILYKYDENDAMLVQILHGGSHLTATQSKLLAALLPRLSIPAKVRRVAANSLANSTRQSKTQTPSTMAVARTIASVFSSSIKPFSKKNMARKIASSLVSSQANQSNRQQFNTYDSNESDEPVNNFILHNSQRFFAKILGNRIQRKYTPLDLTGIIDLHGLSVQEAKRFLAFALRRYCLGIGHFGDYLYDFTGLVPNYHCAVVTNCTPALEVPREEIESQTRTQILEQFKYLDEGKAAMIVPRTTEKKLHFPFQLLRIITGKGSHSTSSTVWKLFDAIPIILTEWGLLFEINEKNTGEILIPIQFNTSWDPSCCEF